MVRQVGSRSSSSLCSIHYHLVWCPNYRHAALVGAVKPCLEQLLHQIAQAHEWKLDELEVMPDHVHVFISAPPTISPTNIVRILKGVTARQLLKQFPHLKQQYFWGGHL